MNRLWRAWGALAGGQSQRVSRNVVGSMERRLYGINQPTDGLVESVLVANRGEIACRVMRTARKLGVRTIAVYSEADSMSPHVELADEAVCIGPAASADSYLRQDRILDAIRQTNAKAVHPGYGFLSERSSFVEMLEDNGVVFVGPGSFAIQAMGDKIESKKLAQEAGVSVIPGFIGEVHNEEEVLEIARSIQYPVMIKASAGGGGKGMRIAWNDEEALEGYHLSKDEAKASFGDDRMLIEKFIDNPRHIEIQIIADSHGNVVYLPERECSIQRRNQKVVEEAPSPFIDPETRKAMGEQAVALAKAVNYKSAGTVEMLVDSQKNFYFLEMNTRLQVEHPVTEEISGVDLVHEMLRVASGHTLSFTQDDISINGWSMESRVYAEDPVRNFLPMIGPLLNYEEPSEHVKDHPDFTDPKALRVDSGIREGSEISVFYDPMISKLVTWGPTREDARTRMLTALDCYHVRGVTNNLGFLQDIVRHPRFASGNTSTKFIPEEYPEGYVPALPEAEDEFDLLSSIGVAHLMRTRIQEEIFSNRQSREFEKAVAVSVVMQVTLPSGEKAAPKTVLAYTNDEAAIMGQHDYPAMFRVSVGAEDGTSRTFHHATAWTPQDAVYKAQVDTNPPTGEEDVVVGADGNPPEVPPEDLRRTITQIMHAGDTNYSVIHRGVQYEVKVLTPRQAELYTHMIPKPKADLSNFLLSPMPGKVVSTMVSNGDKVEEGQPILVLEAMKMQNVIKAEASGVVKNLNVATGQLVEVEEALLEWEK
mmetsp:Transcript_12023/g.33885  ORF Transcript_12023/g.33885 Transcript_12023/m.33885 type:complete len:763 (-) Transcript_12023:1130-3418(-)